MGLNNPVNKHYKVWDNPQICTKKVIKTLVNVDNIGPRDYRNIL
jgi:hypothetical protein